MPIPRYEVSVPCVTWSVMLILTTTFDCKASLPHVYDYYDGSDSIQILLTTCERMCSRVCAAALFSRRCGGHPVVTVISYALLTREEASAGVRSGRESSAGIDFLPQGPCTVPAGQLGPVLRCRTAAEAWPLSAGVKRRQRLFDRDRLPEAAERASAGLDECSGHGRSFLTYCRCRWRLI